MNSNLGMGVMINMLGEGRETVQAMEDSIGQTIVSIELKNEVLILTFKDGNRLELFDNGQSCCESRYMRTDDSLNDFKGAKFLGAEIKKSPGIVESDFEDHEIQFLEIKTNQGVFTMSSHNEHNGYYGGFFIVARYY